MTLEEKQQTLIRDLSAIRDARERLAGVIDRARRLPPLEESFKTPEHKIEGCLANVWFVAEFSDGKCQFRADSESAIVRGIACLLCEFYSGHKPAEILSSDPSFLAQIGITQHLSPNRRNALSRIWDKIRAFAEAQQEDVASRSAERSP